MKKLLSFLLCLTFVGCAEHLYSTHMDLERGMSKKEVTSVLGPPIEKQMFKKSDDELVEYYFYPRFNPYEEKTPICFVDGKLVGWGQTFYHDHFNRSDTRLR